MRRPTFLAIPKIPHFYNYALDWQKANKTTHTEIEPAIYVSIHSTNPTP